MGLGRWLTTYEGVGLSHMSKEGKAVVSAVAKSKPGRMAGWTALAIGGTAALGIAAATFKGERYNARDHRDDIPDLEKDLPKVMEGSDLMAASQPTLMGEPLVKNGPHGMKVRMQRGEAPSAGADVTSPNIERGGVSVIDGREVKDLGPQNSLAV